MFSSPCSPSHCGNQNTEVLSCVTPVHRVFPQVEGRFTLLNFCLKAFDALNQGISWNVLEERLEALAGVLDIPEQRKRSAIGIVACQLQRGSFRDSDLPVRLGHWLSSGVSCKINVMSVSAEKALLWKVFLLRFESESSGLCGSREHKAIVLTQSIMYP